MARQRDPRQRSGLPGPVQAGAGRHRLPKANLGNELKAGPPITLVGDFFYDFGLLGVAIGSLLFGMAVRGLLGLVARLETAGREYRAALYAIGLLIIYELLVGTYSIGFSFAIALLVPFFFATQ